MTTNQRYRIGPRQVAILRVLADRDQETTSGLVWIIDTQEPGWGWKYSTAMPATRRALALLLAKGLVSNGDPRPGYRLCYPREQGQPTVWAITDAGRAYLARQAVGGQWPSVPSASGAKSCSAQDHRRREQWLDQVEHLLNGPESHAAATPCDNTHHSSVPSVVHREPSGGTPGPCSPRYAPASKQCSHDPLRTPGSHRRHQGAGPVYRGTWREPTDPPWATRALKRRLVAERPMAVTLGDVHP